MKNLEEIKEALNDSLPTLKSKFDIKTLWIFGSYLRGGQGKTSDIDILVEYRESPDLFEFMALEYYLSDLLKTKVDLVMKTALKERLRDKILREINSPTHISVSISRSFGKQSKNDCLNSKS